MINDDVLIKYVRNVLGYKEDWPNIVNFFKSRLEFIKSGFPGIRNNHLSFIPLKDIKVGDLFIYDSMKDDDSPLMLSCIRENKAVIFGIGSGMDSIRDPDRIKFRYGDKINFIDVLNIPIETTIVYRVDVRPNVCGGAGYYYFERAYRDQRP